MLITAMAFAGANLLALGCAAWLLRPGGHHSGWATSLVLSTAATIGGAVLLVELSVRFFADLAGLAVPVLPTSPMTFWLPFLWTVFLGPVLLGAAFLLRVKATPRQVYLLQVFQAMTWAYSGLVMFILTVQT